ncbi:MAG: hypothetical protein AAFX93_18025 [Verrucomicrobiota bacterium]
MPRESKCDDLGHSALPFIAKEFLDIFFRAGWEIRLWTVVDPICVNRPLMVVGVASISTNRPDRIRET